MRIDTGHAPAGIATLIFLTSLALMPSSSASAQSQSGPAMGVVWTPPSSFSEIRSELKTMSDHGITAVRVGLVLDGNVHVLADLFGIDLFQEVDIRFSPASRAGDRYAGLASLVDSALFVAERTTRTFYLGLGAWNETTDRRTCEAMDALIQSLRDHSNPVVTYYITPFVETDVCSDIVDFVLVDAGPSRHPIELVDRWRRRRGTPAGVAALRAPVYDGADDGFRAAGSEDAQARYFEEALTALFESPELVGVFVDRWRETRDSRLQTVGVDGDMGLVAPDGEIRPAAHVVRGFYTGGQTVFAFPAGDSSTVDYSWLNLIAFITVALLGVSYYTSMSLRSLVRRYFKAHSFYLEKVGDGRDTDSGIAFFLLGCLAIGASIVGLALVTRLLMTDPWMALNHWLPERISYWLRAGDRYPAMLVPIFAMLFGAVAIIWTVVLSLVTRGTKRLRADQTLLLTVLPRWPVAIVGLLALVLLNSNLQVPLLTAPVIAVVWIAVVFIYTSRVISDYLRILGISAALTIPVVLLAAALLAASLWLFVITRDLTPELSFLWTLASQT